PITYATAELAPPGAVEEERRLLYVGMTRARHELCVSWAAARNPGQAPRRSASRFLLPLLPPSQRPEPTKKRSRSARCRECLQPLGSAAEKKRGRCAHHPVRYDEALFDRLKAWRLEAAREAGEDGKPLPAYVVFTDATLELIAEQKPTTIAALGRVNGVGPTKIERYGSEVLALVSEKVQ
ncbi:MAG: HRDC domain-containing protein, partial [Nocardioidaceae bacterium]|nr:HRDC domain-containing protein [Nocardioidaceae bacterium]